jgi:hypothetical protein
MSSGGRSSWFGNENAETLAERFRKAEEQARDEEFERSVADLLATRLAEYNSRDTEEIARLLDKIQEELGKDFEMALRLRFGGSVSRNTFVRGLSDVDALVLLHESDTSGKNPSEIKSMFVDRLRSQFSRDNVSEGNLAVTLRIDSQEIQLLPAVRDGDRVKISSHDGQHWSTIRPRVFADELTRLNKQNDGKLVPTIKLAKGVLSALPEQRQLSGYHTEVLAVRIFRDYSGNRTPKDMLRHFFDKLPDAIREPMRDTTGQSVYVDEYLGVRDDVRRHVVSDAIDRIARRIRNADGAKSLDRWRELVFEE